MILSLKFLYLDWRVFNPLSSAVGEPNDCKKSWTYFNGSCYKHFSQLHVKINGEEFFQACQAELPEATPVSISSKEENDFIVGKLLDKVHNRKLLIGFSSRNRENWGWSDGSTGKYTNWVKGADLKNEKKKCATIWKSSGKWDSKPCNDMRVNFICKYIPRGTFFIFNISN